jgi:hypothetical protein
MDIKDILKEHEFSDAERVFMEKSYTTITADINQSQVVSELILGKRIEKAARDIIESNRQLSETADRSARVLVLLTTVLVVISLYQLAVSIFQPKGIMMLPWFVAGIIAVIVAFNLVERILFDKQKKPKSHTKS